MSAKKTMWPDRITFASEGVLKMEKTRPSGTCCWVYEHTQGMLQGSGHSSTAPAPGVRFCLVNRQGRTRAQESPANPDQRRQGMEKGQQKEEELRPQLSELLACSVLRLNSQHPIQTLGAVRVHERHYPSARSRVQTGPCCLACGRYSMK